ncbi:MAG: DUF6582 domain-containing protein [Candidatus Helarchaeota archaeon]
MPLPIPHKGEEQNKFISRCMSDETMKREFPDQKQRTAVCYSQWRRNKHFTVFAPITKYWEEDIGAEEIVKNPEQLKQNIFTKGKQRFVEATVTGLSEDRDGEMMSQEAIDDMIKQFKSGTIGFFPDHGRDPTTGQTGVYSWKQMMGVWVDARQYGKDVKATVRLNNAHPDADLFWKYVQEGMPVGLSIGGKPTGPPEVIEIEEKTLKQESYNCECIECGYKMKSIEHCANIKCPKCGGQMRRAERPGPGQKSITKKKVTDMEAERKRRGMSVSQFYAAPRDPPSSSALPIFDAAHVRNAMARFNQTHFLSAAEKAKAKRKIEAAARKFGIKNEKKKEKD